MTMGELLAGLREFAHALRENPNYTTIRQAADDLHRLVDDVLDPKPAAVSESTDGGAEGTPSSGADTPTEAVAPVADSVPDPTRQPEAAS